MIEHVERQTTKIASTCRSSQWVLPSPAGGSEVDGPRRHFNASRSVKQLQCCHRRFCLCEAEMHADCARGLDAMPWLTCTMTSQALLRHSISGARLDVAATLWLGPPAVD